MRAISWFAVLLVLLATSPIHAACSAPATPVIVASPSDPVGVGQPYAIEWSSTAGTDGFYVVERSVSATFDGAIESQFASRTAASFIALEAGSFHHRVRAVAGCDSSLQSAPTTGVVVTVAEATDALPSEAAEVAAVRIGELHAVGPAPEGLPSFILPAVARAPGAAGSYYRSRLRLNNTSSRSVDLDLVFVASGSDVNDAVARTVTLGPNAAISFEDVLETMGVSDMIGNLEIRGADRSVQLLTASGPIYRTAGDDRAQPIDYVNPVVLRGEGARLGNPHRVPGVVENDEVRTNVRFVETERTATSFVSFDARLYSASGQFLGTTTHALRPGEMRQINRIASHYPGATPISGGTLEIEVLSGTGVVQAVLSQIDNTTSEQPRVHASEPVEPAAALKESTGTALATETHALLGVLNGTLAGSATTYRTLLGITAPKTDVQVTITLLSDRALATPRVSVTVPATQSVEFPDVFRQLFRLFSDQFAQGTIIVEAMGDVIVYGSLTSPQKPTAGHVVGNLPSISLFSEALVGANAGFQRPVFFSGLEQFVDPAKGRRWKLELTEVGGAPATVTVLLYDENNRARPLARGDVELKPRQHRVLDTVFGALGLEEPGLATDRTEVQVVVMPKSGLGRVAAVATGVTDGLGEQAKYILTPNGGIPVDGRSLAAPAMPSVDDAHHRPVRR